MTSYYLRSPQVTRSSDVRPLARVITYSCDTCGYETYQEVSAAFKLKLCGVDIFCFVFFIGLCNTAAAGHQ